MRIQAYTAYTGSLTIAVATPRPEEAASTHFTAAKIHEDYCARVRALLREHKHIGETALAYPVASRLQTYFPVFPLVTGNPLYAIRQLMPAGSPRDIDQEFMLEIMRIRYAFTLVILPAYFAADETTAEGIERALEYAVKKLFQAADVPDVVIPGDNEIISGVDSLVSISCELGGASARMGVDIPQSA
jgi:hypothetical protein